MPSGNVFLPSEKIKRTARPRGVITLIDTIPYFLPFSRRRLASMLGKRLACLQSFSRFNGAVFFHGLRWSSVCGTLFGRLGLTWHSTRTR